MTIYLISGNGQGAGKTTLANRLVGPAATYAIADVMRKELAKLYSDYDWFNRVQDYKDNTRVTEYLPLSRSTPFKTFSLRQVMQDYGEEKCKGDSTFWAKKLVARLVTEPGLSVIAIDDVRKVGELETLKQAFPNTYHFHVKFPGAVAEPQYDGDALEAMADYVVSRNK